MPLFGRQRSRSKRVFLHKMLPASGGDGRPALAVRHRVSLLLLWVVLTAGTVGVMYLGRPPLPYTLGDAAKQDVYARTTFRYEDEEGTEQLRRQAAEGVLSLYRQDNKGLVETQQRLEELLNQIQEQTPVETEQAGLGAVRELGIPEGAVAGLKADLAKKDKGLVRAAVAEIFKNIAEGGYSGSETVAGQQRIRVTGPGMTEPTVRDTKQVLTPLSMTKMMDETLEGRLKKPMPEVTAALTVWLEHNVKQTLSFDEVTTAHDRALARQEVAPEEVEIRAGTVMLLAGTRIEGPQIRMLTQEQEAYLSGLERKTNYNIRRLAGISVLVLLMYVLGLVHLVRYQHPILRRPGRLAAMVVLMLLMVASAKLCVQLRWSHYLVPISLLSITLALAHDRRLALAVSVFTLVPVTVTLGNDYSALVVLLLGALVASLLTARINKRTKLIIIGFVVGLVQVGGIWAMGLLEQTEASTLLSQSMFGMVNGVFVGFLITGTLPFLERGFHITTDISLLELADLNQPILRSLALEAPGTYNHSLTVGVLAEAAAEAVGADDMLARVGSYYHDIGKLSKPEYFIENTNSALYRHENLSPTMSTLIIIAHVKDGLEMAQDIGLPPAVRDIIAQHHGTTVVEFFYKKHLGESPREGEMLDDTSFRYPCPKPKTKEAAVVMLADAAESASRTLNEPTPGSIDSLVNQIIQSRLNDGQLNECNITLDELNRIERALVKGLNSIYHGRVRY